MQTKKPRTKSLSTPKQTNIPSAAQLTEMLTPSEIEELRRDSKEVSDFAQKEFAKIPPKFR